MGQTRSDTADLSAAPSGANAARTAQKTGSIEYLTFRVARRDFAIEAAHVRGVVPFRELVPMHSPQPDVAGFMNFGGRTLAVIDLCVRLKLSPATRGSRPMVVVVEHPGGQLAGFIADRVSDVVEYRSRDVRNGVLHGLGRPRRLIELNALMAGDEVAQLMIFAK